MIRLPPSRKGQAAAAWGDASDAEALALDDFDAYQGFPQRLAQEIDQIMRMASNEGDGRFYYSGFAQAAMLDRLLPGWQERIMQEGVWLDELLKKASGG